MHYRGDDEGQDLRKYHVGRYETPATKGFRMPRCLRSVPERAVTPGPEAVPPEELTMAEREDKAIMDGLRSATPGADELVLPEQLTMAERENKARERGVERLAMMDAPRAPSKAAVACNLPQLPARPPRMISYENQGA